MAYSVTSFNKENLRCPCCGGPVELTRIFLPESMTERFDLRHENWTTQTAYGRRNHPSLSCALKLSRHEFLASPKELGAIVNDRVEIALGLIAARCSKETEYVENPGLLDLLPIAVKPQVKARRTPESAPMKTLRAARPFGESPRKLFL